MYVCCHPSNQGEDVRSIQSRVQVGECFWVKRGKALVPGCFVITDLEDLEDVLKEVPGSWGV